MMFKFVSKHSAATLLENLLDKGLVERKEEVENFILSQQQEKELPLYMKALLGVGSLISSLFFIGFLTISCIINFNHEGAFIFWGLIFVAGAIGILKISTEENTIEHSFFMQTSFSLMAIGKFFFVFGISEAFNSNWGGVLALCIISVATYHIYRMSIDRFLSSFAALFSVLINILWGDNMEGAREILFNVFFLFQLFGAAALIVIIKIKRDYIPLMHAFIFSLCVSTLFLASHTKFGYWRNEEIIHTLTINILLTLSLMLIIRWIRKGIKKCKSEPFIFASLGAVVLGIISAPGIILSIILMLLGYARHEKLMIIMGGLLLPVFLFFYYYNLDVSLMQKSGALVGSGIVLLVGNFYLKHKGWDNEGLPCE